MRGRTKRQCHFQLEVLERRDTPTALSRRDGAFTHLRFLQSLVQQGTGNAQFLGLIQDDFTNTFSQG